MSYLLRTLVILAATIMGSSVSASPLVSSTYEPISGGYLLRFKVRTGVEPVAVFGIRTSDAMDVVGPLGWHIYKDSRKVDWSAIDETYILPPNTTLTGFSYVATNLPGTLEWHVSGPIGYTDYLIPTLVPEPSSTAAILVGVAGIGGFAVRRRRGVTCV